MNMNKLIPMIFASLMINITNAEYILYQPIETSKGGLLPNGSIQFVTKTETPTPPVVEDQGPLSQYTGNGTIDTADGSGFLESATINNELYSSVLFRAYGDHSIWFNGNQADLLNSAKSIVLTINGDTLPCEIYFSGYSSSSNQTAFHCSTTGFVGTKYAVGQKFNITFK